MLQSKSITPTELTPALAEFWLGQLRYEGNRPIFGDKVERMARVHLRDEFPETEAIHCTVRGKDPRNLDCQHRCKMVIQTRKPLLVNLKRFDVPDDETRRTLWKSLDQGDKRKFSQALHPDEWMRAGYRCKSDMLIVGSLVELIEGKLAASSAKARSIASIEERCDFAAYWAPAAQRLFDSISGCPNEYRERIRRKLPMAVFLTLFDESAEPDKMGELLHAVAFNEGLKSGSAAHRLSLELQRQGRQPLGQAAVEFMRKIAYCCVRHLEGKPVPKIPKDAAVILPGGMGILLD